MLTILYRMCDAWLKPFHMQEHSSLCHTPAEKFTIDALQVHERPVKRSSPRIGRRYASIANVGHFENTVKSALVKAKSLWDNMSGWYSLSGYLYLKFLGGGFTSLLRSKRRYYFVLDEINCQLAYYKDYEDFARKKNASGNIELKNCAVTLNENRPRVFTLHTIGGRQYELEAEKEESALVWLECLQKRSTYKRDLLNDSVAMDSSFYSTDLPEDAPSSLPSESELAAALDSAFLSCTQSNTPNPDRPSQIMPSKQCAFYFGSSRGSIEACSSGDKQNELKSPPGSPVDKPTDHPLDMPKDQGTDWINQWLSKQEFDHSKQSMISSITTDCPHFLASATVSSAASASDRYDENNYARLDESHDVIEIKKELDQYKRSDQFQKRQIDDLTLQLKKMALQLQQMETCIKSNPDARVRFFQQQNKFLNAEVMRLSEIMKNESDEKEQLITAMADLQKCLDTFKLDYAFLLQSCLRVYVGDKRNDCAELKLFGFDTHQDHIVQLLAEARKLDPSLPTWESLLPIGSGYVDAFGFRNSFTDIGLALHYAASQLLCFYRCSNDQEKRQRWKEYLQKTKTGLSNTKEARALARAGIPARYRSAIWRCLVHQKVADLKCKYGKYYFRGLCNWQASAKDVQGACAHQKQITLDLMRTMPNNVHFSAPSQKGIVQLQAVLQAICTHNPRIGYCQGMNFVTAICLLFLNPEDSFWFLVALTERYFVPNYFDHSLTGAQADQEVLKDILEEKLPDLAKHFMKRDIELATVTLNWFLALFYDSLPFETLLRVWDCFLLEGPKVLFRFVLGLLYMHKNTLLECSDTMSILKALKLSAKHTYDADALVKIAFEIMRPFPRRQELIRRQTRYMEILKIRLQRKDELKAVTLANSTSIDNVLYQIELAVNMKDGDILIVYCSHNGIRKLAIVSCHTGKIVDLDQQYDCNVMAAATTHSGRDIFLSVLSGAIVSLSIDAITKQSTVHWEKRLPDVVLQLLYCDDDRLYAAMANGTLAIFESASDHSEPGTLQLYYIPVGAAPLSCLCLAEDEGQLWCGLGGRLVILNAKTLDCLERLTIANSSLGCVLPIFDRLLTLQVTKFGIWMAAFNSSVIQMWEPTSLTCKLVFDTSSDHKSIHMQTESRITCMLAFDACIWVGTADGYILVYDIVPRSSSPPKKTKNKAIRHSSTSRLSQKQDTISASRVGRRVNGRADLQHRDSGYSGASSYYASTEMLQYTSANGITEGMSRRSRKSAVWRPTRRDDHVDKKRWQSCIDLAPIEGADNAADPSKSHKNSNSTQYTSQSRYDSEKKISSETGRSYTSIATTSGAGGLEYDDLFVPYPEPQSPNPLVGGLLMSSSRSKSQSDWSLGAVPAVAASPKTVDASFTFTESTLTTWTANVDGRTKKSRRQLLRRPTRDQLRRKDLDVDEYPAYQSGKKSQNLGVAMQALKRQSTLTLPRVVTEGDTDNESQKSACASETASVLSLDESGIEPPYPYRLQCIMRLKIADKPVRCLTLAKTSDGKQCAISCAGAFDENDSVLMWTKDVHDQKLWIPKPVIPSDKRSRSRPQEKPNSSKHPFARRSTSPWFRSA